MIPVPGGIKTLSDGRKLGYAEYGDPHGRPVLLFHVQPGNRLFRYPDDELTRSLGVRLIAVDRPGYGLSDFQPGRKLLDWPGDIDELADLLGLQRFAVLGFSAGGPYALACGLRIPVRITKIGLVDSAPPMHAPEINKTAPGPLRLNYRLARHAPAILKLIFAVYWRMSRRNSEAFIQVAIKQAAQADREILTRPEVYAALVDMWKENIRVDCRGYVQDVRLLMGDWGFQLQVYLSQPLVQSLREMFDLQLSTKLRDNMKNQLISWSDRILLRRRVIIETIIDQLKNISQIEHSRHRSVTNFFVNVLCGLIAYCCRSVKPSLGLDTIVTLPA